MAIKLNSFSNKTDIEIKHPVTQAPIEHEDGRVLSITAYSTESKEYADAKNRYQDKMLAVNYKKLNAQEKHEMSVAFLAEIIESFNNCDNVDLGKGLLDPKDKKGILRNHKWLYDQLNADIGDLGNFMQEASSDKKKG